MAVARTFVDFELRNSFQQVSKGPAECYQCGTCTATCPINTVKGQKFTVRKVLHSAQIGIPPQELVWDCTSCKLCETRCPREVNIVESIRAVRKHMRTRGEIPAEFHNILWNVLEEATPTGDSKSLRTQWARGLDIPEAKSQEYLLYVGGPAAADPRLQKVAKELALLMKSMNTHFGLLYKKEPSSGEAVLETGDEAYLDYLIEKNVQIFNQTEAQKIIALSPHDYDVFRQIYPKYGLDLEVLHYTEFLKDMWDSGSLVFSKALDTSVTYHDPCYLGRHNNVYDAPRSLIETIKGVTLEEMSDTRDNALCCGGGGNNMYREVSGERLSDHRVLQGAATGAKIMATSCGYCIQNFEDSTKVTGKNIGIKDVIELVSAATGVSDE